MSRPMAQEIKCTVKTCRHNDKVKYCKLNDIVVGESCANPCAKSDTDCNSFEKE